MSNDKLSNDVSIKHTEVSDLQKEFAILVQKKNKLVSEKEKLRVGGLQYKNKRDGIKDAYDKLLEETTEDQNKRTAETEVNFISVVTWSKLKSAPSWGQLTIAANNSKPFLDH